MPFMFGGSCLHILKASHPDVFEEVVISTILKDVLKALEYLHHHGHIHCDVKAGNILIDSCSTVKLDDFGVSACLFDSGDRQRTHFSLSNFFHLDLENNGALAPSCRRSEDVKWLQTVTKLPILVKGVLIAEDILKLHSCDGITTASMTAISHSNMLEDAAKLIIKAIEYMKFSGCGFS
ncbi:Serine/threonine-protein kinase fray2 [Glycine soja]